MLWHKKCDTNSIARNFWFDVCKNWCFETLLIEKNCLQNWMIYKILLDFLLFAIFYEEKFVYSSEMEIWIYTLNTQTFPTFLVDDSCTKPLYRNNTSNETHIVPSGICGHHGKCHPLRDGKFRCSCDLGWTGERCETGMYFIKTYPIRYLGLSIVSQICQFRSAMF